MKKPLSLYIHIPYCVRKCAYCDFLSFSCGEREAEIAGYVGRLIREIAENACKYVDREVISIFIGGGTPSVIKADYIADILGCIKEKYRVSDEAEISMEANPGTLDREKLMIYRKAGVNRLSIGCQSVHDDELKCLGRIHSFEDFIRCYDMARECGFENINVDLMAGLPGSDEKKLEKSLRTVAEMGPEHISVYDLIIEEGTPFHARYGGKGAAQLPDEETDRKMYHMTASVLKEYGLERYEISNYAKPGYECRHNLVYWNREDYLGLGLNAASCVDNVRWKNTSDMSKYMKGGEIREEREELSINEQKFETMMLGLRLIRGVSIQEYRNRYGADLYEEYGEHIAKMKEYGLLTEGAGFLRLTEAGLDVADAVIEGFAVD
ncbi:MAG: radical SAM family heme chaperone HemW [Lachnospiraceae bacterium]|nr:radical SAM family heme chaperone HemW [Lachnospiraceae bacterium]